MAFPDSATLLDDFNRASLGANWSDIDSANGPLVISGSTELVGGPADAYTGSYYSAATFGPDVQAYATLSIPDALGSEYFGLWVRGSDMGTASPTGYKTSYSAGTLQLIKVVAGVDTQLGSNYSWFPDPGDKIGIEAIGTTIKVFTDEGAGWVERISATDSSISGAGNIAIDIYDPAQDDVQLDDLYAGTVSSGGTNYTGPPAGVGQIDVSGTATADYQAIIAYSGPPTHEGLELCGNCEITFTSQGTQYTGPADNGVLELRGDATATYAMPQAYTAPVAGAGEIELKGRLREIAYSGATTGPSRSIFYCRPNGDGTFSCRPI